jgi:hypothetical protein
VAARGLVRRAVDPGMQTVGGGDNIIDERWGNNVTCDLTDSMLFSCTEARGRRPPQGVVERGPGGRHGGLRRVRAACPAGAGAGRGTAGPPAAVTVLGQADPFCLVRKNVRNLSYMFSIRDLSACIEYLYYLGYFQVPAVY